MSSGNGPSRSSALIGISPTSRTGMWSGRSPSTANTIFDRGYRGAYFIVDFPEIARISSYYLGGRAEVLHSVDDIPDYLPLNLLFIATWSLSEAPLELRNKIAEKLSGADYLILF